MAEGVGFEPTVELPLHGISSAAPSATRPPLLHHRDLILCTFSARPCAAAMAPTIPPAPMRSGRIHLSGLPQPSRPRSTKPRHIQDKLAEGRGFEPPRDLRPYPISSRTPSTGLGHPSASVLSNV